MQIVDSIVAYSPPPAILAARHMTNHIRPTIFCSAHWLVAIKRLLTSVLLLVLLQAAVHAEPLILQGRIVRVTDGDTVTLLDERHTLHKIRLAGIDAPESAMPYGNHATLYLVALVFGKTVEAVTYKQDRYGRTVATLMLGTQDINLAMLQAGLAWHYKQYEVEQTPADRAAYSAAELKARTAKLGLWAQGTPVRPQDFRQGGETPTMVKAMGSATDCPCGTNNFCTGSRGGQYCLSGSGHKKYAAR